MALGFDTKEDLRLRMADLEKKLTESEEERCKLEKTCNVLMRAFKEEEKMRYKALNKKYEKFLEDCTVRKRRNDIILRTLCRIEDRSKVLFAKTERLKLLKDRYVSYLNVNDRGDGFQPRNDFSATTQKTTAEFPSKQIQWKTPLQTYQIREAPDFEGLLSPRGSPRAMPLEATNIGSGWRDKLEEPERDKGRTNDRNGFGILSRREDPPGTGRDNLNFSETSLRLRETMLNAFSQKPRTDESGSRQIKAENCVSENFNKSKDESVSKSTVNKRSVVGHQESTDVLKKMTGHGYLDSDNSRDEGHDSNDVLEKDRIEQNEKNPPNKALDELIPVIKHSLSISSPEKVTSEEEKHEMDAKIKEIETNEEYEEENVSLPKGLDGVDYENETYPESYYEQPTHHNHASIASDVILEEDETEQEEADNLGGSWVQSSERKTLNETDKSSEKQKETSEPIKGHVNGVGGRESGSERSTEEGKTDRSDKVELEKPNKSSLIQLLDSDTESFQIEHGDAVSGNEDSEFDFSFGQN